VRVALEIEAQKKSLDDLIPFVAADKTQMERWVKGDIATPSEIQSTIAVWLGKPVREMFTDIAPLAKP
jgi:hypothetical protein